MKKKILLYLICFFALQIKAQIIPQNGTKASSPEFIALKNVSVYIRPGLKIDKASILISNGKIIDIGKKIPIPKNAIEYDLEGKTIVPAFIELYTNIGMPKGSEQNYSPRPQIESSKKGAYYWNEAIHPEIEAHNFFTVDSKANENYLKSGFGFAVSHVQDGIVRGSGTLVSLGDENSSKNTISLKSGMFYSFSKGTSKQSYPSSQMGSIALLRQSLYDLKFYSENEKRDQSISLERWKADIGLPSLFKVNDKWEILRAEKIASEFQLKMNYIGSGNEYAALSSLKSVKGALIIPLNFPEAYNVKDPYLARQIPLSDMKHWELAASNPSLLKNNGNTICLTYNGSKTPDDFWKNLRKAITRGLKVDDALGALTIEPAKILKMDTEIGSLEIGKIASFSVYNSDPFTSDASLLESWLLGEQKVQKSISVNSIIGKYTMNINGKSYRIEISGTNEKPLGKVETYKSKDTIQQKALLILNENDITIQFNCDDDSYKGSISLHGKIAGKGSVLEGDGTLPDGKWITWSAIRAQKESEKEIEKEIKLDTDSITKPWLPNLAFGMDSIPKTQDIIIKNVTIWTNEIEGIIYNATIFIENGKVKALDSIQYSEFPKDAIVIDGSGKHLSSGIIDEHSHIAISKGVNEGGQAVSAEVSIGDVVNPDDINIYRQLSGGVTAAQLLHGSANPIGGQSALIKLKWGFSPDDMLIKDAPKFIKCALGENVKQANWGDFNTVRFPQSRMGVEQVFYDAFTRAKKYKEEWTNYAANISNYVDSNFITPRKDIELEVLNEILDSKRFISCHSYVQSEINMLMHVADSMGFKINTFTHILEGYKVADKMKKHGAGGSTFSDWWAYKFEVNDAIPYNAKLMQDQGLVVAINSDDAEMGRRLNQEAAKSVKYGGMSEEEAWKMVTLNPAKLLHLDDRMGSVKVGKDADLVLWTGNPLSIESKVELTMVDGLILYNRNNNLALEERNTKERARLINKMLESNEKGEETKPFIKNGRRLYHCDTHGEEGEESENQH
jgi:imidazolonepropionase-like amidohydrolase